MYDEKETNKNSIKWGLIFRRVIKFVIIVLIVLLLVFTVTKCSKAVKNVKGTSRTTNTTLASQLNAMQKATISYLTVDKLPTRNNSTRTVRLSELVKNNKIGEIKDNKGNTCSQTRSYSKITRLENNYLVETRLSCGTKSDTIKYYIGCFPSCVGDICEGNKSQTNGICEQVESTSSRESTNVESTSNINSTQSTNNNNSNTNNNTNTNNSTNSNSTYTPPAPVTKTMYEYRKYSYSYSCPNGGTLYNNKCVNYYSAYYEGYDSSTKQYKYTCPKGGTYIYVEYKGHKCATYTDAISKKVYGETFWSYDSNLQGYEKTGNTKQVKVS